MNDGIIKADGTSRLMRAELPATYEEFRAQAAAGTLPMDILFNAAGWTQLPTFLNKGALLKDLTAALYGLGSDAVPDDVLAWIGKYNQYWWSKTETTYTAEIATTATADLFFNWTNNDSNVISYSDSCSVDDSGKVVLLNPSTLTASNSSPAWTSTVLGKYVTGCKISGSSGTKTDYVYFIPSSARISYDSSFGGYYTNNALLVTAKKNIGDTIYVTSEERNAYPDSGMSGGYEYRYCGIPFHNAVEATLKIASGSYIGTGTVGSSNPNTLTFDFEPKLVAVFPADGSAGSPTFMFCTIDRQSSWDDTCGGQYIKITFNGNTVSWYSTGTYWNGAASGVGSADASGQLNASSKTYRYFAIG